MTAVGEDEEDNTLSKDVPGDRMADRDILSGEDRSLEVCDMGDNANGVILAGDTPNGIDSSDLIEVTVSRISLDGIIWYFVSSNDE